MLRDAAASEQFKRLERNCLRIVTWLHSVSACLQPLKSMTMPVQRTGSQKTPPVQPEFTPTQAQLCGVQAHYIILNGGNLLVGTPATPFPGKATLTLWGHPDDPEMPGFGAKSLAIRDGNLTLHGRHREPTWTQLRLDSPVAVGDTTVIVDGAVNWRAGDQIVITSSSVFAEHAEVMTIVNVKVHSDAASSTITVAEPAQRHHLAARISEHEAETGLAVDMRAEVAVLSRDVVVEGDPSSAEHMFGSVLMLAAPRGSGRPPSNFWLEQIEVRCARVSLWKLSVSPGPAGNHIMSVHLRLGDLVHMPLLLLV